MITISTTSQNWRGKKKKRKKKHSGTYSHENRKMNRNYYELCGGKKNQ
jgi:hypothetical protein